MSILTPAATGATITLDLAPIPPKTEADKKRAYRIFASSYPTDLVGRPGVIRGPIRRGSGKQETLCMETEFDLSERRLDISCLIDGGSWLATFRGNDKQVGDFYEVIGARNPVANH
jgi:hypothetical protein